jgi:translation initiation factor IF-1
MNKFQLYIHNKSDGPYKIPFKQSASYEVKAKIDGTIKMGKKRIVPSDVSEFVDMVKLDADSKRFGIKYRTKEIKIEGDR